MGCPLARSWDARGHGGLKFVIVFQVVGVECYLAKGEEWKCFRNALGMIFINRIRNSDVRGRCENKQNLLEQGTKNIQQNFWTQRE